MKIVALLWEWAKHSFSAKEFKKSLALIALIAIIIFWAINSDISQSLRFITLGSVLLFGMLLFGLFVIMHKYREKYNLKFYDSVASDCDWASHYKGRSDMKNLRVDWKGFKATKVTLRTSANANAAKSAKIWRSIKATVNEIYPFPQGHKVVAVLTQQRQGQLEFIIANDSELSDDGSYGSAEFAESLYAFVYEILDSSYNDPLPTLEWELHESGKIGSLRIKTVTIPTRYTKRDFEKNFTAKYSSSDDVFIYNWHTEGVDVSTIKKDSPEYKLLTAHNSISNLLTTSIYKGFYLDPEGFSAGINIVEAPSGAVTLQSIDIDFMQNDVSEEMRVIRFEELLLNGLSQLHPESSYRVSWGANAYGKTAVVEQSEGSDSASNPPSMRPELPPVKKPFPISFPVSHTRSK